MAVTIIAERNLSPVQNDPFKDAVPCWRNRVMHLLPPEYVNTSDVPKERITHMPIRQVPETEAPSRMFKRGVVSSKQDYLDVINALNANPKGVALIVDMDAKAWEGVKKPETVLAFSLRRRFSINALPITAYQSGPLQVTVRKLTALEQKENASKGAKKK